ncbi:aldose epimerase family protein [Nocardioides bizhenqiangii]|uniref:Aldose 1-epimerase n=1 Tax=Nocardioides bizhenqiangii TaxID=3095076 RepID=A0ABZ0ZPS7_9ACTN|nr:aldose epimerase family protein [Nocardioides sp. HM61]WQQ26366.1 aldose epimerase family protein [Nocardioides sp. HM61]
MSSSAAESVVVGTAPGPELHLLRHGATLHRLVVTGGDGVRRDVSVALPGAAELLASSDYLGGTIGRYANRIAGGRFELDGEKLEVATHDRGNHLHGGPDGFDRRTWDLVSHDADTARLRLVSPDGDQGFPGEVTAEAAFSVAGDTVTLELTAETTRPTVVNLTSHVYLNLEGGGSVDDHLLQVPASSYTPVDETGIPYGGHAPVDGTPFDLREPARVGELVRSAHEQVVQAAGIDHNLVVDGAGWRPVAVLSAPRTATRMELWSDQGCLQVYTGNFLDGTQVSRDGRLLRQGDGIALEPQLAPDTPNHPEWPSAVLRPGELYRSRMAWVFTATPPAGR